MICNDCQKITDPESGLFVTDDDPPRNLATERGEPTKDVVKSPSGSACCYIFKPSIAALGVSANEGCSCCKFLYSFVETGLRSMPESISYGRKKKTTRKEIIAKDSLYLARIHVHQLGQMKFSERMEAGDTLELFTRRWAKPLAEFQICTQELFYPWDLGITRRPNTLQLGRENKFLWLLQRLQHCKDNHPECSSSKLYLPTRLLDVNAFRWDLLDVSDSQWDHSLRLIITADVPDCSGPYVALSHCWGPLSLQPPRTTRKNIKSRLKIVGFSDLPGSFRDAVLVTRALGIRYLWIDSLCIIQDDAADWAKESSCMADVYTNAHVTIGASSAPHSHRGFLFKRKSRLRFHRSQGYTELSNHIQFELPSPSTWPASRSVILQPCRQQHIRAHALGEGHRSSLLNDRAWTLQEQLMSRRFASFDEDALLWKCKSGRYCQGWAVDLHLLFTTRTMTGVSKPETLYPESLWTPDFRLIEGKGSWTEVDQWYSALEEFSRRRLTYVTDALPALSGIAREFAGRTGHSYLAGIWKEDFARGLTWHRLAMRDSSDEEASMDNLPPEDPHPSESSSAPSWSWASDLNGCIIGHSMPGLFYNKSSGQHHGDVIPLSPNFAPLILRTEIVPLQLADHMGQIVSGSLGIEGCCRTLKTIWGPWAAWKSPVTRPRFELSRLRPKNLNQHLGVFLDSWEWAKNIKKPFIDNGMSGFEFDMKCILLFHTRGKSFDFLHCLIVEKAGVEKPSSTEKGSAPKGSQFVYRLKELPAHKARVHTDKDYRRRGVLNIRLYRDDPVFWENWERTELNLI